MLNVGFTSALLVCMLLMLAPGAQSIIPSYSDEKTFKASHGSSACFDPKRTPMLSHEHAMRPQGSLLDQSTTDYSANAKTADAKTVESANVSLRLSESFICKQLRQVEADLCISTS